MATVSSDLRASLTIDGVPLSIKLRRAERTRRLMAFGLTVPLLLFLLTTFIFPIFAMLVLSIKRPEMTEILPRFVTEVQTWDGQNLPPPDRVLKAFATEVISAYEAKKLGKAAKRLNYHRAGFRSMTMKTGKKLAAQANAEGLETVVNDPQLFDRLKQIDQRWGERDTWAVARHASPLDTMFYLLRSVDYDYDVNDEIVPVPEQRAVHLMVLWRTIYISVIVTLLCVVLGFPIAFLLANVPTRQSNMLILLLLLPFWTSLLVRTTAWLVLLQYEGLVNDAGITLGLWDEPAQLVRNRMGTYIGMVHIMLPFMALPLFAVMKRIDPYHTKAAASLGANPLRAFIKVYLPQTMPGLGAGVLLVFIICLGFYLTPALIGGPSDQMLSYYVVFHANSTANWGMASALSLILMAIIGIFLVFYFRVFGVSGSEPR